MLRFLMALAVALIRQASPELLAEEKVGRERLSRVAVPFVPNAGLTDPRVAYYARTFLGTVFVTADGRIVYSLSGKKEGALPVRSGWVLTESVVGAKAHPSPIGQAPVRVSSFIGADPARWRRDLRAYESISLGEAWFGVTLNLRASAGNVEKVFIVKPRADASRIRMRVSGARSLRLDETGAMVVDTGLGEVKLTRPAAYQEISGMRQPVEAAYVLKGSDYGFRVGPHDPAFPVVIDPLLQSTYLGGSGSDAAFSLAIHPTSGDVYVTGYATSSNFPGTTGGAQPTNAGGGFNTDAFVARLSADLTTLTQATYLGGSGDDYANALAIPPVSGDVYVVGYTQSTNFPGTAGGAQPANGGIGNSIDGFVARLSADLTTLTQATYLGGSSNDYALALAIHPTLGDVYVTGHTISTNFPGTTGGAQTSKAAGEDAFVARLAADLKTLTRSTYLGGNGDDDAEALTVNPTSGDVYVGGVTYSTNFPGTAGGAQTTIGGGNNPDAFAARLTADLSTLTQATYLGGFGQDVAYALAFHPTSGDLYVAGATGSPDFPGTAGSAQPVSGSVGSNDGFVARLTPDLTSLTRATYLGGTGGDAALAMAIHPSSGDVYVSGQTTTTDFPATLRGAQANYGGGVVDGFAARLSADLGSLAIATFLGGGGYDYAIALRIHPVSGDVYVAGHTTSANFPATAGGAQPANGGVCCVPDGFVARLTEDLAYPGAGFYTLAPCRVADTRGPSGPSGGPALGANATRVFPVAGICDIPQSATAVAINLAVVLPAADGDLRVYPTGRTPPNASSINFRAEIVRANNAIVPLGIGGQLSVQCDMSGGSTQFFFDVYGYFQ